LTGSAQGAFLSKTFGYLASSLAISAICATLALNLHLGIGASLGLAIGGLVLLIILMFARESAFALPLLFLFAAVEGLSIGPTIGFYLAAPNGPQVVASALGTTAVAFFSLMAYASTTKRNFSFLGSFLFAGLIVVILMSVIGLFWHSAAFQLTIAGITAILFCGYLLFDLWRIWNGGETNPIMAAVSLYLDILNLFMALLRIFGYLSNRD